MKTLSTVLWDVYLWYKPKYVGSVRWSNMTQINTSNPRSDMQTVQTLCDKGLLLLTFDK